MMSERLEKHLHIAEVRFGKRDRRHDALVEKEGSEFPTSEKGSPVQQKEDDKSSELRASEVSTQRTNEIDKEKYYEPQR